MVELKNISSIILFLLSFMYCFQYMLRDIYYKSKNFHLKKNINKILPFFTKYNGVFLIFTFIISILFFILNISTSHILGFILIVICLFNLILVYNPKRKIVSTHYLRILSYILMISVIIIPILQLNS